jgi:hypothetical protein
LLELNPEHKKRFLAETVPAFGAVSTLNRLKQSYPDYTYRGYRAPFVGSFVGAGGNGIDDVLGCYVRRLLSVRQAPILLKIT